MGMRIKDALKDIRDLDVDFGAGSVLHIKYRPSSFTVSDLSDLDNEAKRDPYRIITIIRDMVLEWDLLDNSDEPVSLLLPSGAGNIVTVNGDQIKTKASKQELMRIDPIAQMVPITLLTTIIRAVNEDQSAGN
jgi:hypothetical protein